MSLSMPRQLSRRPAFQALERLSESVSADVNDIRIVVNHRATKGFDLEDGRSQLEKLPDKSLTLEDARKFLEIDDHVNLLRFGSKFNIANEAELISLFAEFTRCLEFLYANIDSLEINGFDKETLRELSEKHIADRLAGSQDKSLTIQDARNYLHYKNHKNVLRFGPKFNIADEQGLISLFAEFPDSLEFLKANIDSLEISGFDKEKIKTLLETY